MTQTMKFFLVELTYTIPAEQLGDATTEHRAYLQKGYDQGMLLFSGPQVPRVGGIIIARGQSQQDVEAFFQQDPFQLKGLATYRFVQFDPVKRQPLLDDWLTGK